MALAIDASSPVAFSTASAGSITSASFTPPSGSLIVISYGANGTTAEDVSITSVTNTGTAITWNRRGRKNKNASSDGGAGQEGGAEIWTGVGAGSAVTVTINGVGATSGYDKFASILVFTGADTSTFNVTAATSASGLPSATLASCLAGSHVVAASADWAQKGNGTAGSGQTIVAEYNLASMISCHAWRTSAVLGAGGSQTMNLTAPAAQQYNLVVLEVRDAAGPPDTLVRPTKVSDRGTAADATAGTTTAVTVTSPTTVAVGNYMIARVAVDNSGTSGAAPGCTVTDTRNTWTVLGPGLADPGAASAGSTAYLCYAKVTTAYQAADTITFNWGGISTTAKAIVLEEWSYIHSTNPIAVAATTNDSGAAASTTAVTISRTPTGVDQLVYACLATEGIAADTVGTDSDTTNGSWAVLTTTASANATATNNQRVSGAYKVVTAAGAQSWDSTITSRDWAAVAVVFNPPDLPPPLTKIVDGALVRASYW